jgi:hypothetical protein
MYAVLGGDKAIHSRKSVRPARLFWPSDITLDALPSVQVRDSQLSGNRPPTADRRVGLIIAVQSEGLA